MARGIARRAVLGALLVGGLLSILPGVVTFLTPRVTALVLLYLIAAWAIFTGVSEVVAGIRLRNAGALAVTLWIGAYATVLGIILILLAFRLRKWGRVHPSEGTLRTA